MPAFHWTFLIQARSTRISAPLAGIHWPWGILFAPNPISGANDFAGSLDLLFREASNVSSRLASACTSCFVRHVIVYRRCPLLPPSLPSQSFFRTHQEAHPSHTFSSSMASLRSTSTQPSMEEAQVLYFTCWQGNPWSFRALPISKTHLDSTPASAPQPIHKLKDLGNWDRLGELIDELARLLAANGALEGWYVHGWTLLVAFPEIWCVMVYRKIHLLGEPVIISGYFQAKVVVSRTMSTNRFDPSISLPSTIMSSPADARREENGAVREVRRMLELGTSPG